VGADLTGTPHSFSIFYRDVDIEQIPGNNDYRVRAKWTRGQVGDLTIAFNASGGGWRMWEDFAYEFDIPSNADLGYPRFYAYLGDRTYGDAY
jgi:hypothetical protein